MPALRGEISPVLIRCKQAAINPQTTAMQTIVIDRLRQALQSVAVLVDNESSEALETGDHSNNLHK